MNGPATVTPDSCEIVDVGPPDGLQNESVVLDDPTRVALVEAGVEAGLRRVEVVSFVRADRVPQMAGAEELMAAPPRGTGPVTSGRFSTSAGSSSTPASTRSMPCLSRLRASAPGQSGHDDRGRPVPVPRCPPC
jgi:hypothetical protein